MLYRVTEPALRPIRSILPNLGGIDISPVILILFLLFIRDVVLLGWIAAALRAVRAVFEPRQGLKLKLRRVYAVTVSCSPCGSRRNLATTRS